MFPQTSKNCQSAKFKLRKIKLLHVVYKTCWASSLDQRGLNSPSSLNRMEEGGGFESGSSAFKSSTLATESRCLLTITCSYCYRVLRNIAPPRSTRIKLPLIIIIITIRRRRRRRRRIIIMIIIIIIINIYTALTLEL